MIVENGMIKKITEKELFLYYRKSGYDEFISFTSFMEFCKENGTEVIESD